MGSCMIYMGLNLEYNIKYMKKTVFLFLGLVVSICANSQMGRPSKLPNPSSNGYAKWGYIRQDSGLIMMPRDTFPAKYPTIILHTNGKYYRTEGNSTVWKLFGEDWSLTGNTGTVAGTNFIGTKDAVDWVIKTNNTERARVTSSGTATFIKDALVNNLTIGRGNSGISDNSCIGFQALSSNTTGVSTTSIGYQSLFSNTTGNANTANGARSLYSNTTGGFNTSTGSLSMYSNTTGSNNTANGNNALYSNTTGIANTANGGQALRFNTTGFENTATGYSALYQNTIGAYNTATGHGALVSNTTGNYNTATGHSSLLSNTAGNFNVAFGYGTLLLNSTGVHNAAFGTGSLAANTIGVENTATGNRALGFNTLGNKNTANGYQSSYNNTEGSFNTSVGHDALYSNQFGNNNSVFGYEALKQIKGDNNTMVGTGDAGVTDGDNNTLVGNFSVTPLPAATSNHVEIRDGDGNLAFKRDISNNITIPLQSLQFDTTTKKIIVQDGTTGRLYRSYWPTGGGAAVNFYISDGTFTGPRTVTGAGNSLSFTGLSSFSINGIDALVNGLTVGRGLGGFIDNTVFGESALSSNIGARFNTSIGFEASKVTTGGIFNTGVGYKVLNENITGSNNTALGGLSGQKATSSSNTLLGYSAGRELVTGGGNNLVGTSSGVDLVSGSNNSFFGSVNGITTGSNNTVVGNVTLPAATTNYAVITDGSGNIALQKDNLGNTRINVQALQVVNVSAAALLNLDNNYSDYVFSGTTTTWILPPLAGYTNVKYFLKNRGTGNITLNTFAGGNDIYYTSAINTINLLPGESAILGNDGTYWNIGVIKL